MVIMSNIVITDESESHHTLCVMNIVGGDGKDLQPNQAPSSSFPSLADAAKVQKVPVTYARPNAGPSQTVTPGRPKFINTDKEKLRRKLAEREAAASKH